MINFATNSDLNQQSAETLNGGLPTGDSLRARQPLSTDPDPDPDTDPDLLTITVTTPATVNVQLGSNNVLAFSLPGGSSFPDGIEWTPPKNTDTALFINFNFTSTVTSTIKGITCPYFQVAYGPTVSATQCVSIQPSRENIEFLFKVHLNNGGEIDPKIKITPT